MKSCFEVHLFGIHNDFASQVFCGVLQAFLGRIEVNFRLYFGLSAEINVILTQAWLIHSYDLHFILKPYLTGKASLNCRNSQSFALILIQDRELLRAFMQAEGWLQVRLLVRQSLQSNPQ